jgi:hypothetical protein
MNPNNVIEVVTERDRLVDMSRVLQVAATAQGIMGIGGETTHDSFKRISHRWAHEVESFIAEVPDLLDPDVTEMAAKLRWAETATDEELRAAAEEKLAEIRAAIETEESKKDTATAKVDPSGGLVYNERGYL